MHEPRTSSGHIKYVFEVWRGASGRISEEGASKGREEVVSARQGGGGIGEVWGKGRTHGGDSGIPGTVGSSERLTWTMMGCGSEGAKDGHILKGRKSHVGCY